MSVSSFVRRLFSAPAPTAPAAPPPALVPEPEDMRPQHAGAGRPDMTMDSTALSFALEALSRMGASGERSIANPFAAEHRPPPGVGGKGGLAMDAAPAGVAQWSLDGLGGFLGPRQGFIGFPELALMAQRPEYRSPVEIIATEATRKWIKFTGDAEKVKAIEADFERLDVRSVFRQVSEHDGAYGRGHIFVEIDGVDGEEQGNIDELKMPIGTGDDLSKLKIGRGSLTALRTVEPVWVWPISYNSINPLTRKWYRPQTWFCMSFEVHKTRLLTFISREVPDLLKPAYMFGGQSLTQLMMPVVENWLSTRAAIGKIVKRYSQDVIKVNLTEALNSGNADKLFKRIKLFAATKNNSGMLTLDKEAEDYVNVSIPLGSLDLLQAQAQEHMCSLPRIPQIKLLGIQPAGLNATSEGELRAFEEMIHSYQEFFYRPNLTTIFKLVQLNLWGAIDEDLAFEFETLTEELTEGEKADASAKVTSGVAAAFSEGVIDRPTALREIKVQLESLGITTSIDDAMIAEAEEGPPAPSAEMLRSEALMTRAESGEGEGGALQ